ncbi:hypothetical protein HELRODRAFT_187346 [Helobdella robusta]|uniref:NIPSNAP domain-containing protein n=1 Tax=Helobdella robusta TaxID=6412 RepID=T1FP90_HELRO|nr:hypothetical protein HELRODRAFT_187346 [Helobdella robusta]ESN97616.1 hypothetical protein HELRODRAFT_187346 [Helobdella robusta]
MEAVKFLRRLHVKSLFRSLAESSAGNTYHSSRGYASTSKSLSAFFKSGSNLKETNDEKKKIDEDSDKSGWLRKMMGDRLEAGTESHSNLLAVKDIVYELQMHKVRPEAMDEYLDEYEKFSHMVSKWGTGGQLLGSWTVEVGDLDEATQSTSGSTRAAIKHWTSTNRYSDTNRNSRIFERGGMSSLDHPGTMIDWGNSWARGLKYRQTDQESVAGFFSHIGELYQAHHLWAYDNLAAREEVRDAAWDRDGWHECVANTVPLVRRMVSRILIPTKFSPLK